MWKISIRMLVALSCVCILSSANFASAQTACSPSELATYNREVQNLAAIAQQRLGDLLAEGQAADARLRRALSPACITALNNQPGSGAAPGPDSSQCYYCRQELEQVHCKNSWHWTMRYLLRPLLMARVSSCNHLQRLPPQSPMLV
jgi:hypothetical protein